MVELRALTTENKLVYFSIYQIREYYPDDGIFYIGVKIGIPDSEELIACKCGTEEWKTGLKDSKNKEIYEGDIVRILYTDWPSQTDYKETLEEYKKSISSIGIVVFKDCQFCVKFNVKYKTISVDHYNSIFPGKHGEIEAIGNIHENQELLNPPNR